MLILYENLTYTSYKTLYDYENCRVMGHHDIKGWVWTEDLPPAPELGHHEDTIRRLRSISSTRNNKAGWQETEYNNWEDFVIDKL
tara:strand:- start:382 stop:636 length:255 start_codon:yes stop_codon:yes gene_type:complete